MGGTPSVSLNVPIGFRYFGLMFAKSDKLWLLMAPSQIIDITKVVINNYWKWEDEVITDGFCELSLKGEPWSDSSTHLQVKYFVCSLLKEYYTIGWHIKSSSYLQKLDNKTSVLIFELLEPVSTSIICLSLKETDLIQVLAPINLIPLIKETIIGNWPLGIEDERHVGKGYEFKLRGYPWSPSGYDSIESFYNTILVNAIIANLYYQGWVFASAIDTTTDDINALYFKYNALETQIPGNMNRKFFSIALENDDLLRIHNASEDIKKAVKTLIPKLWQYGIGGTRNLHCTYEIQLNNNPWWCEGLDTVDSRRLFSGLFSLLSQFSSKIYAVCDLTGKLNRKSTFFFHYKENTVIDPFGSICVSLHNDDIIRVIDSSREIVNAVKKAINIGWKFGIEQEKVYGKSYQLKLIGNPFDSTDEQAVDALVMMIYILNNIEQQGYRLIATCDISSKYERQYAHTLHSWYFRSFL